jgi:Uma2 family endonuclease
MSAVTIAEAWPKPGEPFTVDDLERMPDDGRRYELIDGMLIVSPAPNIGHQRVIVVLISLLEQACPDDLVVFPEVGVGIAENSALEPDVVVARVADTEGVRLGRPPLLVAEVLSPDSVLRDLNLKKAAYERFGIPSYWVV